MMSALTLAADNDNCFLKNQGLKIPKTFKMLPLLAF